MLSAANADRNFLLHFTLLIISLSVSLFYTNICTKKITQHTFWYSYIHFPNAAASNLLDQFKLSVWASVRFKQHLVVFVWGNTISRKALYIYNGLLFVVDVFFLFVFVLSTDIKWHCYYDGMKRLTGRRKFRR